MYYARGSLRIPISSLHECLYGRNFSRSIWDSLHIVIQSRTRLSDHVRRSVERGVERTISRQRSDAGSTWDYLHDAGIPEMCFGSVNLPCIRNQLNTVRNVGVTGQRGNRCFAKDPASTVWERRTLQTSPPPSTLVADMQPHEHTSGAGSSSPPVCICRSMLDWGEAVQHFELNR
jgi:hypothetical protein